MQEFIITLKWSLLYRYNDTTNIIIMQNYKAQSIVYEQGICKHQTRTVDDILWTSPSQLQTGLSYALYNNQLVQ